MVIFRTQAHPSWRLPWESNNTNNKTNPQVNENVTMHDRSSQIETTYCDAIFLNENVNQQRMLILLYACSPRPLHSSSSYWCALLQIATCPSSATSASSFLGNWKPCTGRAATTGKWSRKTQRSVTSGNGALMSTSSAWEIVSQRAIAHVEVNIDGRTDKCTWAPHLQTANHILQLQRILEKNIKMHKIFLWNWQEGERFFLSLRFWLSS